MTQRRSDKENLRKMFKKLDPLTQNKNFVSIKKCPTKRVSTEANQIIKKVL